METSQSQITEQSRSFRIYTPKGVEADSISNKINNLTTTLNVTNNLFLDKFASKGMTKDQLKKFAIQWYKVISSHKVAFSGLVYNTPNELLRADLITILYDEYGLGDPKNMHTALFSRIFPEIGISQQELIKTKEIKEVEDFRKLVDKTWVNGSPAKAYGLVYLFEKIGVAFHTKFWEGLKKSGISEYGLSYSKLHSVAEKEHAEIVVNGLEVYKDQIKDLEDGIKIGAGIMISLWKGLDKHAYSDL